MVISYPPQTLLAVHMGAIVELDEIYDLKAFLYGEMTSEVVTRKILSEQWKNSTKNSHFY